MSHGLRVFSAKPAFQGLRQETIASDYIVSKRNNVLCCKIGKNRTNSYQDYLTKKNLDSAVSFQANKYDLVGGLYTTEDLCGITTLCSKNINAGTCSAPTNINVKSVPFYSYYVADPAGELFGNTLCGTNNYANYMRLNAKS